MNDLEKAARQALEALNRSKLMDDNYFYCYAAAKALRQALEQKPCNSSCAPGYCYCKEMTEQPKQEPVAWLDEERDIIYRHNTDTTYDCYGFKRTTPLYKEPPKRKWVGLTDKERRSICDKFENDNRHIQAGMSYARAIESWLKERNT